MISILQELSGYTKMAKSIDICPLREWIASGGKHIYS